MYIVIEIQKMSDTQAAVVTPFYTAENFYTAQSEFHRLCSIAAISSVPWHTVLIMGDGGFIYKKETFVHEAENDGFEKHVYIVFEIQKFSESSVAISTPIYATTELKQAEAEFHRLSSVAAQSQLMRYTVAFIDDEGFLHKVESYDNPVEQPEE